MKELTNNFFSAKIFNRNIKYKKADICYKINLIYPNPN